MEQGAVGAIGILARRFTLPCRGRVGLPKAVRGGVAEVQQGASSEWVARPSPPPAALTRSDLPPPGGGETGLTIASPTLVLAPDERRPGRHPDLEDLR